MSTAVSYGKVSTKVAALDLEVEGGQKGATTSPEGAPPLGQPRQRRFYFWQKKAPHNPDDIATQPSVYDVPELAHEYKPRDDWENIHRFNPLARWTWREEDSVLRKLDLRIMAWTCLMFIGLEIDRANLHQALSDNLLGDLGLNTNDYNYGNMIFSVSFLAAELPSQLISKRYGPERIIPFQLSLWSVVAASQFALSGRTSFYVTRSLLGLIQGGFIPDIILYLSYFYTHAEMSFRLGLFYMSMTFADILVALLAFGILRMRGVLGYEGWRWMFLIEGLITLLIGLFSFLMMPSGPTQTAGGGRGKNGWFTPREEEIMVNRVIRDDPNKGDMHNRQRLTLKGLWHSLQDLNLWPLFVIGLSFNMPVLPPARYLTLSLRSLGFDVFQTNLMVIPAQVLKTLTMLLVVWLAESTNQVLAWAAFAHVWALPFLIWLRAVDIMSENPWVVWIMLTLLTSRPMPQPLQVSLVSRNSNSVRNRTVSAAVYNMCTQAGSLLSNNIYTDEDAPLYKRGNSALIGLAVWNLVLYAGTKVYYMWINKRRDREWESMSLEDQAAYAGSAQESGSRRKDFRFAS